jgi:hypothetical protein
MDAFLYRLTQVMFQNLQPVDFLILLFGFIYGNLFVLTFSRFQWDFFLIFSVVFFLEVLNKLFYFYYQNVCPKFEKFWISLHDNKNQVNIQFFEKLSRTYQKPLFFFFQLFKRGFLLGLFVEAFKVGS